MTFYSLRGGEARAQQQDIKRAKLLYIIVFLSYISIAITLELL